MTPGLINANPVVHQRKERSSRPEISDQESTVDPFDALEIYDHVRDITDPEHPYSLEQLNVVSEDSISVDDKNSHVTITFTPTVQHCSMATVIGLCLRVKLLRALPPRFKQLEGLMGTPCLGRTSVVHGLFVLKRVDIQVAPGSHASEAAVNKQLNDKERVAAALENPHLVDMVDKCLAASEG